MYFTDHKKREGKERGAEEGRDCGPREDLGARTLSVGTWHWLRESLDSEAAAGTGSIYLFGGKERREARAGGKRVQAEVDGRGPGFLPLWEPRVGRWL